MFSSYSICMIFSLPLPFLGVIEPCIAPWDEVYQFQCGGHGKTDSRAARLEPWWCVLVESKQEGRGWFALVLLGCVVLFYVIFGYFVQFPLIENPIKKSNTIHLHMKTIFQLVSHLPHVKKCQLWTIHSDPYRSQKKKILNYV